MKTYSSLLCLLLYTVTALAQTPGRILARAELNNKKGYIDLKGHAIVPIQYDDLDLWGDGLIAVNMGAKNNGYEMVGGKWGYCDENGKMVIPLKFQKAGTFHEGLAAVRLNGKWGFIDTTGKLMIQPQYDDVLSFKEGLCAVSINRKFGFIDTKGTMVIRPQYADVIGFDKGVALAYVGRMETETKPATGGYCLIDKTGRRLTKPIFRHVVEWHEDMLKVSDSLNKVGFVNRQGRVVVPLVYDQAGEFCEGLAAVGKLINGTKPDPDAQYEFGYVDITGGMVIKGPFNKAGEFYKGRAIVGRGLITSSTFFIYNADNSIYDSASRPKFALIDKTGSFILPFQWGWLDFIDSSRLIASRAGYLGSGVIDVTGREIVPFAYVILSSAGHDLLVGQRGGTPGRMEISLIDGKGQLLYRTDSLNISQITYDHGLIPANTRDPLKNGFLDKYGHWAIPCKYDMVWPFVSTRP